MAKRSKRLGTGLSALIPDGRTLEPDAEQDGLKEIPLKLLKPNPRQPRQDFSEEALRELQSSIEEHGVIQPLIVVRQEEHYIIVAGERRYRAAKRAGLASVPCIIRSFDDHELMQIALVENLQREDLNPIEEASAYQLLAEEFGLTQQEISERVGKSRSYVANMMRLVNLPLQVQEYVSRETISVGHARALMGLSDREELLLEAAQQVVEKQLNVRQTEKLVKRLKNLDNIVSRETQPKKQIADLILREFEDSLKHSLGTNVRIRHGRNKRGKIEIEYYSEQELERLVSLLGTKK